MTPPAAPLLVCLLGAESTGKTTLSHALAERLGQRGWAAQVVPEALRDWCAAAGRTPRPQEQLGIAQEQERRVDQAVAAGAQAVVADTSALMVAIYSAMLFADGSLHAYALAQQRRYTVNLLMALDLPWVPDGLQREGPHVRAPVDAQLRQALGRAGVAWHLVHGSGPARADAAWSAIESVAALADPTRPAGQTAPRWRAHCARCGDAACEHRLFNGWRQAQASDYTTDGLGGTNLAPTSSTTGVPR